MPYTHDEINLCTWRVDLVRQLMPQLLSAGFSVEQALAEIQKVEVYVVNGAPMREAPPA